MMETHKQSQVLRLIPGVGGFAGDEAEMHDLVTLAKNLAWELKPDTPLFEDYTMEKYWLSLPRETKMRYIGAIETTIQGLIQQIKRDQALSNSTLMFLQGYLR
jgi:hypothetical protein